MSDAKPYTMERLDAVLSEWEQGGKPRFVSEDLRATVRALDAAQAEVTALQSSVQAYSALVARNEEMRKQYAAEDAQRIEALRARVAELEAEVAAGEAACRVHACLGSEEAKRERDEWKAKAEAAEKVRGELVQLAATAEVQRDEAAALAERLREALHEVEHAYEVCASMGWTAGARHRHLDDAIKTVYRALSTPAPAWLAERDRKLAMRVAEKTREDLATRANDFILDAEGGEARAVGDVLRGHDIAAIVDAALKEKP